MPVTFQPAKHPAEPFPLPPEQTELTVGAKVLRSACPNQYKKCSEIFQSSLDEEGGATSQEIIPRSNGFVRTVVECYSHHRALVIRPDDVWLAILTQFNFFVNGNAEQLRKQFVSHEDKKELDIEAVGTRYTVDFGSLSRQMAKLIDDNIVDPTLREWILPKFSTTTITDTTVGSMIMMATLKEYFSYSMSLVCGIPRVTLEGEKQDWQILLERLEKLKDYGEETSAWYRLLLPVISRFVKAFDNPDAEDNLEFWQKVAHHQGGGSGPTWLAGWINAFCAFDSKGRWIGHPIGKDPKPPSDLVAQMDISDPGNPVPVTPKHYLILDDIIYHRTDTSEIPDGFAEVDVKLNDNGEKIDTVLTAGLVGAKVCDSGDTNLSPDGKRDTAKPVVAWWIFSKKDGA